MGVESNREIDFGLGSCVRARALDVESERAQNFALRVTFSLFCSGIPPLFPWEALESKSIQVKPSETKSDQVRPSETK